MQSTDLNNCRSFFLSIFFLCSKFVKLLQPSLPPTWEEDLTHQSLAQTNRCSCWLQRENGGRTTAEWSQLSGAFRREMIACWSMKNEQPSHSNSFLLVPQSSHWSVELETLTATAKLKKLEATWQYLPETQNLPAQGPHILDSTPESSTFSQWPPTHIHNHFVLQTYLPFPSLPPSIWDPLSPYLHYCRSILSEAPSSGWGYFTQPPRLFFLKPSSHHALVSSAQWGPDILFTFTFQVHQNLCSFYSAFKSSL